MTITRDMAVRQAAVFGCEPACILAVAEVESANSGFLADGRPCLLFEAQWFHQFTAGRFDASHPDISSPIWNRALYRGGAAEYDRLVDAMALDAVAAYKSASWGAFQIMGFNHVACGFPDVLSFVTAMKAGIEPQLAAFDGFIRSNPPLQTALVTKDWTTFARLYNGLGAVAQYAAKITVAYQMHARADAAYIAVIPPPQEAPPAPNFAGPPIPTADALAAPPAGFSERPGGNVVIDDLKDSGIIKKTNVAQVVTIGAGTVTTVATTAGTVKAALGGFTLNNVGIIVVGAVLITFMVLLFFYLRGIRKDRTTMNKQGIA